MRKREIAKRSARNELRLKESLVAARVRAGLNQTEMADLMGVSKSTISRLERVDSDPRLSEVLEYSMHAGVVVNYRVESPRAIRTSSYSFSAPVATNENVVNLTHRRMTRKGKAAAEPITVRAFAAGAVAASG